MWTESGRIYWWDLNIVIGLMELYKDPPKIKPYDSYMKVNSLINTGFSSKDQMIASWLNAAKAIEGITFTH